MALDGRQTILFLNELGRKVPEVVFGVRVEGIKLAEGLLKRRVFTEGKGDIYGKKLSPYSEGYAKKRKNALLQTAKKDLQYTGALSGAIKIRKESKDETSLINSATEYPNSGLTTLDVAEFHEKEENTTIFAMSDKELQRIEKAMDRAIEIALDKLDKSLPR